MSSLLLQPAESTARQTNRTPFSMHGVVLEQRERTRKSSKAEIKRFIEESDSKIASFEAQINALVELRDRERACVAALRHLISPIHTLPVELLAEIFELTIRDYLHVQDVFRISQVCSEWRQVVHEVPRLWTGPIRIDLRKLGSIQERIYADGLRAWLNRTAPLTVPVYVQLDYSSMMDQHIPEQIMVTAPRWRSLHMDHSWPPPFFNQLVEAKLDNLEELDMGERDFEFDDADFNDDAPITSFSTVPRLQKLRLHIYSNRLTILVPWAQLTNLTLGAHYSNIALDILVQCPNLVRAAVSTTGRFSSPEARQNIAILSHLRVLSLPFFGPAGGVMHFLDHLAPAAFVLEELSVEFGDVLNGRWSQAHFAAFQRQAPSITHLELKWSSLT
ncbi:hypothetical protein C8R45DRAFT_1205575 [Mycena sanguinolenta]|nr:hypothetical protein C8R45DRAFT_1205575 [Mycena sanguinolenta]